MFIYIDHNRILIKWTKKLQQQQVSAFFLCSCFLIIKIYLIFFLYELDGQLRKSENLEIQVYKIKC